MIDALGHDSPFVILGREQPGQLDSEIGQCVKALHHYIRVSCLG